MAFGVSQLPKITLTRKEKKYDTTTKLEIELMKILSENEQNFALEFIKKLVLV